MGTYHRGTEGGDRLDESEHQEEAEEEGEGSDWTTVGARSVVMTPALQPVEWIDWIGH